MTTETAAPERFPNRKQAFEFLRERGHKVSRGKFYEDCNKGFPMLSKDGSLSKFQVLEYGLSLDKSVEPDAQALSDRESKLRRDKAEAQMAEMKARKMQREEDSMWLHADEAWSAIAVLVGTLRDSIRHHLYSRQGEIVHAAAGEPERSHEVFECMDDIVNSAFNEVAGRELQIDFAQKQEEAA